MSYKASSFFQDILVNEFFYVATKSKQLIRHEVLGKEIICVWTNKETAETFLTKHDTDYDQIKKIDIDRFVTYEIDDVFEEGEEVLMDPSSQTDGDLVNIVEATNELMSDLDEIRLKEFVMDVAKEDAVFGLSNKEAKQFIMISDDEHQKPHIMPVWSIRNRAEKVRNEDFEECDIIEVEGEVFAEWLDILRDDDKAVAVDLKPGVVGTVVSAQKMLDQLPF
ncbi:MULTISPECIES: DUF2750 domain-containing protein [Staphylococcus]|jgi:hypothetical protein|uniref:DUF2750 domain-containing protein n=1 Tax=Staphylococcus nepalensis TaxID=214473 RepID=A0A2T4S905_9STAP|nr:MULTISPECIES: DUF2750 domain-containing protein [Staphylococcus]VDG66534.1 Protein of uncharacterised function (DUF2750) [Lacrimispora indolis]AWI44029.1 hypothetical protein BJG88_04215 [Staphylococcus nepalensis]MBO1206962.1 DUF2750 domain-containing protein [Staphylococcus nepalensis]MBO1212941.1 DUF2750 domain-containing protein [Staphylococcus nepalensis]MBO1217296.1 DUF2750 domain-containing protein [Staphylococcus nepalensis]